MENNTDPNSTGGPNISEQSTRINNNQTTSEWAERSKYKIPILSDRETDLTKITQKCGGNKYRKQYTRHIAETLMRSF